MPALLEMLDQKVDRVIQEISPNDLMYRSAPAHYFPWGDEALRCIRLSLLAAGKEDPRTILDLPSGHGRVLRTLKAAFPDARLTACDLDRDAVDFCARVLGATPVYSTEDPSRISLEGRFDLIWCGSLLTHLDADRWPGFLELFNSVLAPGGILLFTTHGRWYFELLSRRILTLGLSEEKIQRLLAAHQRNGFGYEDYAGQDGYGISLSAPWWVCARLDELSELRILSYSERGWWRQHDVVACIRSDESAELAGLVARTEGAVTDPTVIRSTSLDGEIMTTNHQEWRAALAQMGEDLRSRDDEILGALAELREMLGRMQGTIDAG